MGVLYYTEIQKYYLGGNMTFGNHMRMCTIKEQVYKTMNTVKFLKDFRKE